jgi:hypothetical protein
MPDNATDQKYFPCDCTIYTAGREDSFIWRRNDRKIEWTSAAFSSILSLLNGCKCKDDYFNILVESDIVQHGSLPLEMVVDRLDKLISMELLRPIEKLKGKTGTPPPKLSEFVRVK